MQAAQHCLRRLRDCEVIRSAVLAARQLRDRAFDCALGIHTAPPRDHRYLMDQSVHGDHRHFETTDYVLLRRCLRPLALRPSDVVFEIGCGMGRPLCMFARQHVRKCIGVEIVPELAAIAMENARRLRGRRAEVQVLTADAATVDYSEGTVFWLNSPFGPSTLRAVLERIEASLRLNRRRIRMAYVPDHYRDVLKSAGWLICYRRWQPPCFSQFPASYWTNMPSEDHSQRA